MQWVGRLRRTRGPYVADEIAGVGRALAEHPSVNWPVHGLRHPPEHGTSGWYLWTGELLEDQDDFFLPMHPHHLAHKVPALLAELDAPPGSRFLLAPGYRDTWHDPKLLDI